ncbi:hypothetical protein AAW51_2953 [Caldimonas brevitalea]|uniref:Uncharacterized protein n=1 Tax=Caldimonas brevitalea TaxID=413882 RepID=A0A0G3BJL2_9BURK|nr:hypothetical protein AAW51_2953 [Caldimonas brevitalea]
MVRAVMSVAAWPQPTLPWPARHLIDVKLAWRSDASPIGEV